MSFLSLEPISSLEHKLKKKIQVQYACAFSYAENQVPVVKKTVWPDEEIFIRECTSSY